MKSLNIQKDSNLSNDKILLNTDIQNLISRRNTVILHVISRKFIDGIPVQDKRREASVLDDLIASCAEMSLENYTDLIIDLWNRIMTESKKLQQEILRLNTVLAEPMSLDECRAEIDQIDKQILIAVRDILRP